MKRERKRINITITPRAFDELQRISNAYKFSNICEVCTSLISAFIQHVNKAEAERRKQKAQTNEEYIEEMFNAFSDWEPTPERAIMYRHNYVARLDHEERKSSKPNTKTPDSDSIPDNNDTIYLEDIEAFSRERNDDEDE